jgi:DNA-binding NarL/FixJ family response regulator
MFRMGLRELIEKTEGVANVAAVGSPEEWLANVNAFPTDVVVLHIQDEFEAAVQLLLRTHAGHATTPVLILTHRCDPALSRRLVLAGARGVVFKDNSPEHLLTAIRKVHEGELWLDRATTAQIISDLTERRRREAANPERAKIQSLTSREREVIHRVAQGLDNKRIAAGMAVSEHTVRHHLTSIFAKLELPNRLALAVYAHRNNLSQPTR